MTDEAEGEGFFSAGYKRVGCVGGGLVGGEESGGFGKDVETAGFGAAVGVGTGVGGRHCGGFWGRW